MEQSQVQTQTSSVANNIQGLSCGNYPRYTHGYYIGAMRHQCMKRDNAICNDCNTIKSELKYLCVELEKKVLEFNHFVLDKHCYNYTLAEQINLLTMTIQKVKAFHSL